MVRAYSRCKFIFHQQFNREQRTLHFNFIPGICDFFFLGGGGGGAHIKGWALLPYVRAVRVKRGGAGSGLGGWGGSRHTRVYNH